MEYQSQTLDLYTSKSIVLLGNANSLAENKLSFSKPICK